ncbi:MAG: spore coat protein GerQ [Bacilli bacterium]|nr:spore coat protein GerQ [Bacilli bacterium]
MNSEFYSNPSLTNGGAGSPLYYRNPTSEEPEKKEEVRESAMPEYEPYMENILKKVEPVKGTFYMTFPGSNEWRDKAFSGILEATGKDYLVVSDPKTGKHLLLPIIYIDYIEFDENIQKFLRKSE